MILELESREFLFESGQACLIPSNWEELALDTGRIPTVLPLEQGRLEGASVERPGEFDLWLSDVSVVRRSDGSPFLVPMFFVPEPVKISHNDVLSGTATLLIEAAGPYSITLFDSQDRRPLVHRKLRLSVSTSTLNVRTDESGNILFLCMPTLYRLQLDPGVGMTIVKV